MGSPRAPTIIIPYKWPITEPSHEDVFVYLRPETNGIIVESLLLGIIRGDPLYRENITVAYLANIPGDFITGNRIIENHYADRLYFTLKGKAAFTGAMRRRFEEHFNIKFDTADVVGAFEALTLRSWNFDELFRRWVDQEDVYIVNGQSVKLIDGLYIVNYDIPALLHKNNKGTDIAVMIFRSNLDRKSFMQLVADFRLGLVQGGVIGESTPLSHALHFSKSPFEQILDAEGYLYTSGGEPCPFETIRYADWLSRHGLEFETIRDILRHPVMEFRREDGSIEEEHLFVYTAGDSYETAYRKLQTAVAQLILA